MLRNFPQPRWGMLYLALPLAGALFWLIQRVQPMGTVRSVLDLIALLVVGGYLKVWHWANTAALLHHPLTNSDDEPIYYVRVDTGFDTAGSDRAVRAVFVTDSYNDLFSAPVQVAEPYFLNVEVLGGEEAE